VGLKRAKYVLQMIVLLARLDLITRSCLDMTDYGSSRRVSNFKKIILDGMKIYKLTYIPKFINLAARARLLNSILRLI
jgi:hypothetical protein